jgi:hypothetical protein
MFDYFGVLVSVILGLALTHLLRGLAKLLQLRRSSRIYVPQLLWSFNVVLNVLAVWWGMFWWRNLADWNFGWFLFITLFAIVLFIWSYMLYPPEIPHDFDAQAFFFDNRRWFFALALAFVVMDILEVLVKARFGLRVMPQQYPLLASALVVIGVVGLFTSYRRVHAVLPVAWFAVVVVYELLSAVHRIVASVH